MSLFGFSRQDAALRIHHDNACESGHRGTFCVFGCACAERLVRDLLAVAKAVVEKHDRRNLMFGESEWDPAEFEAVRKLNAQHPGWRTWE